MDFGWPNVEIGQKIASGQLLFLGLESVFSNKYQTIQMVF